jgi:1,5-anhydro-D-fructose reductase (1,5-anhydro-D-mannitol-forming)
VLRIGLVGLGDAGRHHARALGALAAEGVVAWMAICGRDPARTEAFRKDANVPRDATTFGALEALLASKTCDAVILATPDGLHAEQTIAAAKAGLHVLVEKPLAWSRAEAERVLAVAKEAHVHLQVGYQLRHHAGHRLVHDRLAELVGVVRNVDVRWAWPDPATTGWRARGQDARFWALAALGTHAIDLALWLGGGAPARIVALCEPADGVDRASEVTLQLSNGAFAHVSVAVTHRAHPRLHVVGDLGELEALGTLGARGGGTITHRLVKKDPTPLAFTEGDPYLAQLRDFAARAASGFTEDDSILANVDVLDRIAQRP